ncbi:MAG: hypothetical protein AAF486_02445 [Pseudomonadota bacterium]
MDLPMPPSAPRVPPLARWREIVWPLFWPVFLWNLRGFVRLLERQMDRAGADSVMVYDITWWGAIRVHWMQRPAPPPWDAALTRSAARMAAALAAPAAGAENTPAPGAARARWRQAGQLASNATRLPRPVATGRRASLCLGAFAEPAHLNRA